MKSHVSVAIIGAGPTGIGAAWRLAERDHPDWLMLEAGGGPGGLASSVVDDKGFTWDLGGHVLFSHYRYFDALMDTALGDAWVDHEREAWVRMRARWIPYPFQNNLWRLPREELLSCLDGLFDTLQPSPSPPAAFDDWLLASFGRGLCDAFMFPYNFKVWAYPPRTMGTGWVGERVATVDLRRIVRNVVLQQDDVGWGPNATFSFPLEGGTGAIWASLANQLPHERVRYGSRVVEIDAGRRTLRLEGGETCTYDTLISTMPLDLLLQALIDRPDLRSRSADFVHSSSHIVGLGIDGPTPEALATKCWMYFPEDSAPFYRATVFSNYSRNNVPRPGEQWSLMAEVSESPEKPVDARTVVEETVDGFLASGLLREDHQIISRWHRRLEHGYPTPWLGRDGVLGPVNEELEGLGIYSRGRFGAWKYEVSNQDHSLMQGVEVVERILDGAAEHTFNGDMKDYDLDPEVPPRRS